MANIEDIVKLLKQHMNTNSAMNALLDVAKAQEDMNIKFSGVKMLCEWINNAQKPMMFMEEMKSASLAFNTINRFKELGSIAEMLEGAFLKHQRYNYEHFDKIKKMTGAFQQAEKFKIPQNAYDTILSIGLHQQKIFNNYRSLTEKIQNNAVALSQFNNLKWAINGLSGEMAGMAAQYDKWEILDGFAEINEEVTIISDYFIEQEYITKNDIEKITTLINKLEVKIDTKDNNAFAILLKYMAIISFILALMSEIRNWIPKHEAVTKSDIEVHKKELLNVVKTKLNAIREYRTTIRPCKVFLKPKAKCLHHYLLIIM